MYHKHSPHFTVETNNAQQLVVTAAGNIEKLLAKRSEALKVSLPSQNTKNSIFPFFLSKLKFRWRPTTSEPASVCESRRGLGPLADTMGADILQPADLI